MTAQSRMLIPQETSGLRLCKVVRDQLVMCESVVFEGGWRAVDTILRRAAVHGKVGPVGETGDFWADLIDTDYDLIETIKLSREAWNGLKNHWMRCKLWHPE